MNYLRKNFKTLRNSLKLSQEQFGKTFGLSTSNIKSYEAGTVPPTLKFLEMMNHYDLDPSKFVHLDMEKHSVKRAVSGFDEGQEAVYRSKVFDLWLEDDVIEKSQFDYLDGLPLEEVKALHLKQHKAKQLLLKEILELKDEYKALSQKYTQLLESTASDQTKDWSPAPYTH